MRGDGRGRERAGAGVVEPGLGAVRGDGLGRAGADRARAWNELVRQL